MHLLRRYHRSTDRLVARESSRRYIVTGPRDDGFMLGPATHVLDEIACRLHFRSREYPRPRTGEGILRIEGGLDVHSNFSASIRRVEAS